MKPVLPISTVDLFEPLHRELLVVLRNLSPDEWTLPTVARQWVVRDVAAHLLDGDLRALSALRDGHVAPPDVPIDDEGKLVAFLDRLNAEWVKASHRLSPGVLTDLLAVTGPAVAAVFRALPPDGPAPFPVAWAGESVSTNWMHIAREYTERWHHQMQIRTVVGQPGLLARRWFYPLLDISMRALPHAYRDVPVEPGTSVTVAVGGDGGGVWAIVREDTGWRLYEGEPDVSTVRIGLDPDTAWRTLYHALLPAEARNRATVDGPDHLAAPFFRARSVMVRI